MKEISDIKGLMSTVLIEDETETLLPLCEANRQLVVDPSLYVYNAVFQVGSLKLIDKAP